MSSCVFFCITSIAQVSALVFFFFNDTATTEIYTLSLHDALPILFNFLVSHRAPDQKVCERHRSDQQHRSEEHTSELQSLAYLVCRLLLEKKKNHPRDPQVGARGDARREAAWSRTRRGRQ